VILIDKLKGAAEALMEIVFVIQHTAMMTLTCIVSLAISDMGLHIIATIYATNAVQNTV